MKKKNTVDLKSLWQRASKARKTTSTLTPMPPSFLLQCLRFILQQGLPCHCQGHDQREESLDKGDFLELLKWLAENLGGADKVVLQNALNDPQMTSPKIQKALVKACAKETSQLIVQDLGEENFAILVCGLSDACHNEQLAICLWYVDKKGRVVEKFIVMCVENTAASTIKTAIESLLMDHSLSLSRVHGQGYDGEGNMRDHVNCLKKLIMDESPSAHYVNCFSQELHLALVAVAKENDACADFFEQIRFLVSVIQISCKKIQMCRVAEAQQVLEGLNPEIGFGRRGDTRWGSHHKTVVNIVMLYPTI